MRLLVTLLTISNIVSWLAIWKLDHGVNYLTWENDAHHHVEEDGSWKYDGEEDDSSTFDDNDTN